MMNATNGLTKQNCNVACLQNRKNPIVYVLPEKNHFKFFSWCVIKSMQTNHCSQQNKNDFKKMYQLSNMFHIGMTILLVYHEFLT